MEKTEEKKEVKELLVLKELPTIETRGIVNKETGEEFEVLTIEEALSEILKNIRELRKSVG